MIDVGAGIGDFSIVADLAGAQVYAYDIDPERIRLLKLNLKINQAKRVKAWTLDVKRIDELMDHNNLDRCGFLKIDCEGEEYLIFTNTSDKVLRKINFIAMEAHLFSPEIEHAYHDLMKRLKDLGFKLDIFNNDVHTYLKFVFASRF